MRGRKKTGNKGIIHPRGTSAYLKKRENIGMKKKD